jgi:hypothetical protein
LPLCCHSVKLRANLRKQQFTNLVEEGFSEVGIPDRAYIVPQRREDGFCGSEGAFGERRKKGRDYFGESRTT